MQGVADSFIKLLPQMLPNTTLLQSSFVAAQLSHPGEGCILNTDPLLAVRKEMHMEGWVG